MSSSVTPTKKQNRKNRHISQYGKGKNSASKNAQLTKIKQSGIADMVIQTYKYAELPTVRFATAVTFGNINYVANAMNILFSGGSTALIPYWTDGLKDNYRRYRVQHSYIRVAVCSRELVKNITLVLVPVIDNATGTPPILSAAAAFSAVQSLPFAKSVPIGPISGGGNVTEITHSISLEKFIGPHYNMQDEYAGTCTHGSSVNPATNVYWMLAFYNPDSNTLTTGGLQLQVTLKQVVKLYEPDRDDTLASFLQSNTIHTDVFKNPSSQHHCQFRDCQIQHSNTF